MTTHGTVFGVDAATGVRRIAIPGRSGSAFKIAENESPRPIDRVFINVDYYDRNTAFGGGELNRQIAGFEKTFFDGNASFGLRVPVIQSSGGFGLSQEDIGDVSAILKFALYNNRETGTLFSTGVVVTAPTGPSINVPRFAQQVDINGAPFLVPVNTYTINDVLIQPFVGYILAGDRCFIQGFTSVAVPTDHNDVTLLFNDIQLGYRLYQARESGRMISSLIPTVEFHANDPLNHRGSLKTDSTVGFPDLFDVTAGLTIGLCNRASLSLGASTPVSGPRPYNVEGLVQFNLRF